nr:restriction endonuclease subunit S [endosymbiont GvMRE of Glomus versiforme]
MNPSKSEVKNKQNLEVSFLPMEDCKEYSLYVYPKQTRKIENIRKDYAYFVEDDLLIAKITPCFENGKMSVTKYLKSGVGFGSNKFFVLRAKEEVLIEWVYYYLRSSNFLEEGKTAMTGTDGRRALRKDFIENFLIPVPPLEVQEKFVRELKEEQEIINWQKQSINLLKDKEKRFLASLWEND